MGSGEHAEALPASARVLPKESFVLARAAGHPGFPCGRGPEEQRGHGRGSALCREAPIEPSRHRAGSAAARELAGQEQEVELWTGDPGAPGVQRPSRYACAS